MPGIIRTLVLVTSFIILLTDKGTSANIAEGTEPKLMVPEKLSPASSLLNNLS